MVADTTVKLRAIALLCVVVTEAGPAMAKTWNQTIDDVVPK